MNDNDGGCAYILGHNGTAHHCGAALKPGSSYCAVHHAVCYIPISSPAGQKRLAEIESAAAGGAKLVFSVAPKKGRGIVGLYGHADERSDRRAQPIGPSPVARSAVGTVAASTASRGPYWLN